MSFLGLDIGTTNCKGAIYSSAGRCLGRAVREYSTAQPQPGWAELDARVVVESAFEIVRELGEASRQGNDPIAAISVSALGEAVVPVSADRKILRNAILHSDTRGRAELDHFMERISPEELYAINGNVVSTVFSLPKILWLRKHEPEIYRKTDKFLLFGELIFYLLGCEALTSFSQASRTLLFDFKQEKWSERLLHLAELDSALLSRPVPSGTLAGTLSVQAAQTLGLDPGVACVVGAHDQCCNALGVGICAAGRAVDGIGTVECITPVYGQLPDLDLMRGSGLHIEHHAVPGLHISFVYNQAGSLVKWFRDTFAMGEKMSAREDIYERLSVEMPQEPTRLLVLPHFEPTGAPSYIHNSSGVILGLKTSTTRGEILKALMESATFYFLECFDKLHQLGIDTSAIVASGGGAKSDAWLQIKADIMGIPYERASEPEAGALGAAIIAARALGEFKSYEEACGQFIRPGKIFEPEAVRHRIYRDQFEKYRQLFPRLHDLLRVDPAAGAASP